MRHLVQNLLIKSIYGYLTQENVCDIYDDVPKDALLPYATFGVVSSEDMGAKEVDATTTSVEIHIYSESQGRKELNDIAEAIIDKLSGIVFDLSEYGYYQVRGCISNYDSEPEDVQGYHGVITYVAEIQYKGGEQ